MEDIKCFFMYELPETTGLYYSQRYEKHQFHCKRLVPSLGYGNLLKIVRCSEMHHAVYVAYVQIRFRCFKYESCRPAAFVKELPSVLKFATDQGLDLQKKGSFLAYRDIRIEKTANLGLGGPNRIF